MSSASKVAHSRLLLAVPIALAVLGVGFVVASSAMPPRGKTPFASARWSQTSMQVQLGDGWREVLEIHDVPLEDLVEFGRKTMPSTWRDRIASDTGRVLTLYHDSEPPESIALVLGATVAGGAPTHLEVELDERKFETSAWGRSLGAWGWQWIPDSPEFSVEQLSEDVGVLLEAIRSRFSYSTLTGYDYEAAFADWLAGLDTQLTGDEFLLELRKLMAPFGDGHSRPRGSTRSLPQGCINCVFREGPGGRIIALLPDQSSLLAPEHPYIKAIDGTPLSECVDVLRSLVTRGSPQFEGLQTRGLLSYVNWMREQLGLPQHDQVSLELESQDRASTRVVTLPLVERPPVSAAWPRTVSRVISGNIGYLRLERMSSGSGFRAGLSERMQEFRDTAGLVVDVRGNGGGSRDALRVLAPYFLPDESPALVLNLGRYRGERDHLVEEEDALADRAMYPVSSSRWSPNERVAIDRTMRDFEPDWVMDPQAFSQWFVMMAWRKPGDGTYFYSRPVVVLTDSRCFSATDIFVGALKGIENVRVMGTPTSGGSGRTRGVRLPQTGVEVSLSSMASFRRSGARYDGKGVAPDSLVAPSASYWVYGGEDNMLEAALADLRFRIAEAEGR